MRSRNGFSVQADVRTRDCFVLATLIHKDQCLWKPAFEIWLRRNVFAVPSASANERRCDQEDCGWFKLDRSFSEKVYHDSSTDRVPDEDRAVAEAVNLRLESVFPRSVVWISFIGHLWITNLVIWPQLVLEIFNEFTIPVLVDTVATTLNKKDLSYHCSDPFLHSP